MTRKLTLFLVCAFEIALILFVAATANSFDGGSQKINLACRTTYYISFLGDRPTTMNNFSFNVTVNKDFIQFSHHWLKREPSVISSKVFGYGHDALPYYDDEKTRENGNNISKTLEIFQDPKSFAISYFFADTNYPATLSTGKCNKK